MNFQRKFFHYPPKKLPLKKLPPKKVLGFDVNLVVSIIAQNRDAVNGSHVGCRIRGKRPSDKEIGMWIRAMGIALSRQNVDVTDPAYKPLKEKKVGSVTKRHQQSVFSVNLEKMQPLTSTYKRRRAVGQRLGHR